MKKNLKRFYTLCLFFTLSTIFLTGCSSHHFTIKTKSYTLSNGLKVILAPRDNTRFTTVLVTYKVGGFSENPSILGTSHLLEHLMFQSATHLKRGEFNTIIEQELGGSFNAMTTYDATTYYSTIPSTGVARVLGLEAERMNNLIFVPDEVQKEKGVVLEEMRYRIQNSDTGFLGDKANTLFFSSSYPYGRDLGGTAKVFDKLEDKTIKDYYKKFYAPNNATLIVTGKIDANIKNEIQKAFGALKAIKLQKVNTDLNYNQNMGTFEIKRPTKTNYVLMMAKTPKITDKLIPALNLLGNILSSGNNSYLQNILVKEKALVSSISSGPDMSRMPASFSILFTPYNIAKMDEIKAIIIKTLTTLKDDKNLSEKIKEQQLTTATSFYSSLQSAEDLAFNLAQGIVLNNNPNFYINLVTSPIDKADLIDAVNYLLKTGFSTFYIKKS